GDADRMNALLRESRVVDNPGSYPAALLDRRQNKGSNLPQQGFLRPVGIGDKMVQRLMRALDPAGFDAGRYRLDALALAGKNEPRTVGAKWRPPIRVPQGRRHVLHIRRKSSLASPAIRVSIHRPLRIRRESKPSSQMFNCLPTILSVYGIGTVRTPAQVRRGIMAARSYLRLKRY